MSTTGVAMAVGAVVVAVWVALRAALMMAKKAKKERTTRLLAKYEQNRVLVEVHDEQE